MTYTLASNVDLSYSKPVAFDLACYGPPGSLTTFKPWTSTWPATTCTNPFGTGEDYISYEQPIISDIEFDQDGSLIIGILDRFGMQSGFLNYGTNSASTQTYVGISGGDVIRICNVN